jgi:hypothetical protein
VERIEPAIFQRKRQPAGAGGRCRFHDSGGVRPLAQERQRDVIAAGRLHPQLALQRPRVEAGAFQC